MLIYIFYGSNIFSYVFIDFLPVSSVILLVTFFKFMSGDVAPKATTGEKQNLLPMD